MAGNGTTKGDYLPALRWRPLTPLFDMVARATTREPVFKGRVLDTAQVRAGEAVLDLGCGTGTLAIEQKERCPAAHVTGLDADPAVLSRARRKADAHGTEVELVEGLSNSMPFDDRSFDVVLSTLFFHHLTPEVKRATIGEIFRVTKPGGRLYVGDYGKPSDPLMWADVLVVRLFDGFGVTADNVRGNLPALFEEGGFEGAGVSDQLRSPLGTLAIYAARKPTTPGA